MTYHLFSSGEVLTAANVNQYLMLQSVMVFADSSARTTALTGVVAEGQVSYLTGTNELAYYDGASWIDVVDLSSAQTLSNKTLTSPLINLGITTNTSTTYTTVLSDNGKIITSNNASAQTLSIPTNASVAYPVGAQLTFAWITGAGQPTITAVTPGTTTILSTGATSTSPKLRAANSVAAAIKIATDIWLVTGDIS